MVREVKVMEAAAAAGESPGKEVKAGELVAAEGMAAVVGVEGEMASARVAVT